MARRGRPEMKEEDRRNNRIAIAVTKEEKDRFKEICDSKGIDMAESVRNDHILPMIEKAK